MAIKKFRVKQIWISTSGSSFIVLSRLTQIINNTGSGIVYSIRFQGVCPSQPGEEEFLMRKNKFPGYTQQLCSLQQQRSIDHYSKGYYFLVANMTLAFCGGTVTFLRGVNNFSFYVVKHETYFKNY